jgi:tRNA (guanine-N7-)-methyltransferase
MGQKKLARFEAIKSFENVFEYPVGIAGKWRDIFGDGSITLELACGKGEYTVELAKNYPNKNFIGVDLKGNRLYVGAKKCIEQGIRNAAFLRISIDKITDFFSPAEVSEIWLTFPDPHLRTSRAKKRLTHPRFLRLYQRILVPGGLIHLKTDSPVLYNFTRMVIDLYRLQLHIYSDDVYAGEISNSDLQIQTHYEKLDIAQSKKVYYVCFSLPADILPQTDLILQERIKENEKRID